MMHLQQSLFKQSKNRVFHELKVANGSNVDYLASFHDQKK